ncbi:hypothetical protein WJX74_006351 [Apatococcus lobatus]|uniref:Uncharacterized protein n=1 Tax=Apatococcus lobatus TaxID=904363 RepID=A0AAW1QYA9_9CHLO
MVGGSSGSTVRAVRAIEFGPHRLLEQLDALDDDKHVLKFHILSHPSNINPFPGSYVNSRTKMSMQPISMGDQAWYEIDTKFLTERDSLDGMQHVFQTFQETICQNLQQWAVNRDLNRSRGSEDQRAQHVIGNTTARYPDNNYNRQQKQQQYQQQHQQWQEQQWAAAGGHPQFQPQQQQQQQIPTSPPKMQPGAEISSGESQSC